MNGIGRELVPCVNDVNGDTSRQRAIIWQSVGNSGGRLFDTIGGRLSAWFVTIGSWKPLWRAVDP